MKSKIYSFILVLLAISTFNPAISHQSNNATNIFVCEEESIRIADHDPLMERPRILLFSCNYGSGHIMAAQGIEECLPDCDINTIDVYQVPLKPLDPMREFFADFNNEKIYNELLKNEYNRLLNLIGTLMPKYLCWQQDKIENLLLSYLSEQRPNLVISCVPLIDSMLFKATHQLGIPLLVVTTDIDVTAFTYCFESIDQLPDKQKFRMTVPYAKEHFKHEGRYPPFLLDSFQYEFGYPTRRAFSEEQDKKELDQLRIQYGIQSDENVILVMMGGNTSQAAKKYAQLLLEMDDTQIDQINACSPGNRSNIRMICLCGNITQKTNHTLMTQLNNLNKAPFKKNCRVHIHACPGTPLIAQLASLPELRTVISKPGGSTVNEMIKKKIPMVYHVSSTPLDWEIGNMEYGEVRDFGRRYQIHSDSNPKAKHELKEILAYTFSLHTAMHTHNRPVPEAEIDFAQNLRSAIKDMLNARFLQDGEDREAAG